MHHLSLCSHSSLTTSTFLCDFYGLFFETGSSCVAQGGLELSISFQVPEAGAHHYTWLRAMGLHKETILCSFWWAGWRKKIILEKQSFLKMWFSLQNTCNQKEFWWLCFVGRHILKLNFKRFYYFYLYMYMWTYVNVVGTVTYIQYTYVYIVYTVYRVHCIYTVYTLKPKGIRPLDLLTTPYFSRP